MPGKYKSVRARDCSSSETDCLDLQSLHGPHGFPSMTNVGRSTVVLRVKQPPGTEQYCMCMPSPSGEYVTSEPTADVTQIRNHHLWSMPQTHQKSQKPWKTRKHMGTYGFFFSKICKNPHVFAKTRFCSEPNGPRRSWKTEKRLPLPKPFTDTVLWTNLCEFIALAHPVSVKSALQTINIYRRTRNGHTPFLGDFVCKFIHFFLQKFRVRRICPKLEIRIRTPQSVAIFAHLGFLRLIEGCPLRVFSFVCLVPCLSCIEGCPLHVHLGFRPHSYSGGLCHARVP